MHRRLIQLQQVLLTAQSRAAGLVRRTFTGRPRALVATILTLSIVVLSSAGGVAWFAYDLTTGLPNRQALRDMGDMVQSTTIFDATDRPAFTIFKEQRIEVPLPKVSQNFVNAVISVEDQRFFDHSGIDAVRIGGAVIKNLQSGRRSEGGSTITQQLARLMFLNRGKTYRRKLKEMIVAAYLENLYSKQEILEMYVNKVYFGDGLHGVEAAARGYFGKPASELKVDEAALLAGLIQSPSSYAPTVNLDRAVARRNVVLQTMVGYGAIDTATAERAKAAPVKIVNALEIKETFGLYFKEQVRRELVEKFGWQRVYQGGLRVYTTIDSDLQKAAEAMLEDGLQDIEKRPGFKHAKRVLAAEGAAPATEAPGYLQGALMAMDPSNGHVRVMVGGRNFGDSHFNRAVQAKRQSGSAFKPFVYAAALEAGYSPASLITGLNDPILTVKGAWLPEDDHNAGDEMTMRAALRTSSNRAAVQMLASVGIPKAVGYAEKLNVGKPPSVPSLALGASDVTLATLTAAYGAFADGGIVRTPILIRRVEDSDGVVLYQEEDKSHRAVSEATAFLMASMLQDVISAGTGFRARQSGFTLPGGRQDRHDERLQRRVVRRLHAAPRDRRLGRLRSAADDCVRRLRRRAGGSDLGRVHEARDARRQARLVRASGETSSASTSAGCQASCRPAAATTSRSSTATARSRSARWSTPSISCAEPNPPSSVRSTAPRSPIVWPVSSARTPDTRFRPTPLACHRPRRARRAAGEPDRRRRRSDQGRQGRGAKEEARLLGADLRPRRRGAQEGRGTRRKKSGRRARPAAGRIGDSIRAHRGRGSSQRDADHAVHADLGREDA